MLLRRLRPYIGILLIIAAGAGLYLWESTFREELLTTDVVMTKQDILEGEEITKDMLKTQPVLNENLAADAVLAEDIGLVCGLAAKCALPENVQLSEKFLRSDEEYDELLSPFTIPAEWILSRSGSLRSGDTVKIYGEDAVELLGEYKVAFVRDSDENEVKDADGRKNEDVWQRGDSSGKVSSIEIAATIEDYEKISEYVYGPDYERGLIIVQNLKGGM